MVATSPAPDDDNDDDDDGADADPAVCDDKKSLDWYK